MTFQLLLSDKIFLHHLPHYSSENSLMRKWKLFLSGQTPPLNNAQFFIQNKILQINVPSDVHVPSAYTFLEWKQSHHWPQYCRYEATNCKVPSLIVNSFTDKIMVSNPKTRHQCLKGKSQVSEKQLTVDWPGRAVVSRFFHLSMARLKSLHASSALAKSGNVINYN
jgi:hypothetical protein